jgi:hypothetical protein
MSYQKRVHHVGREYQDAPSQTHDGIKSIPMTIEYWCGKVERVIREEPIIRTPEEQARYNAYVARVTANPIPECEKCKRAKMKAKQWLSHLLKEPNP